MNAHIRTFVVVFGKDHNDKYADELNMTHDQRYKMMSIHSGTSTKFWGFREFRIVNEAFRLPNGNILVQKHDERLDFYRCFIMTDVQFAAYKANVSAIDPHRQ